MSVHDLWGGLTKQRFNYWFQTHKTSFINTMAAFRPESAVTEQLGFEMFLNVQNLDDDVTFTPYDWVIHSSISLIQLLI